MSKLLGLFGCIVCLVVLAGCAATSKEEPARRAEAPAKEPAARTDAVAAGQAVYDANCGSCHKAGRYDQEGKVNLARRVGEIEPSFLASHHGQSLSSEDISNLKAFLSSQ